MKKILALTTFLIIILSSISKVYSIEADVFVQSTVNRASEALSSGSSKAQKIEKLKIFCAFQNIQDSLRGYKKINLTYSNQVVATTF